jgi:malate synthase
VRIESAAATSEGLRANVAVGLRYLDAWLQGVGAAAIFSLMEDTATAEISRSQVWQWLRHGVRLEGGGPVTAEHVRTVEGEELERMRAETGAARGDEARELFERVALGEEFVEFLTHPGYEYID